MFDLVGGAVLEELAGVVADPSRLLTAADRPTAERLGGTGVVRNRSQAVLETVAQLAAAGVLDPRVSVTYPLSEAGTALRAVESGHAQGKIVIEVSA
ncbi:hypothetical protein FAIPA1_550021 [Frankia sp. AiPs1]